MKNIKRVAGASAGAIIATLIALGYDSRELREFLEQDLRRILVGELTKSVFINISAASPDVVSYMFLSYFIHLYEKQTFNLKGNKFLALIAC